MKNENKNQKNSKTKFSLSALISDNRFLMILSCAIAFALWTWVAIEKSPEISRVISAVPVHINLENSVPEQLGLSIFGESEFTVDVTVTGKKYVVSSLDPDDLEVTANTNYVDGSGEKTLQIKVTPKEQNSDYVISSYSQNYIEVFFDTYKEVEVSLEGKIITDLKSFVPDGCRPGDTVFSRNTLLISGPATEINKITNVVAEITIDKEIEKTTTFEPVIKIVTNDGTTPEYISVSSGNDGLTATIPVLKEVVLPTAVEFRNSPSYYINNPLSYTIYPSKVTVALPVDMIDTIKYFVVDTIDFADISSSLNTFTVNADTINSFEITDSWVTDFTVKIDASDMASRTITVPASKISVKNNRDDFDILLNNSRDVTVKIIGSDKYIDNITAEDISVVVDTKEQIITENTTSLSAIVTISGENPCWAVGKYDIKVKVEAIN